MIVFQKALGKNKLPLDSAFWTIHYSSHNSCEIYMSTIMYLQFHEIFVKKLALLNTVLF